jgi:ribonuclease HI
MWLKAQSKELMWSPLLHKQQRRALHAAVILIKEMGFCDVIVEGDALQIVQEINFESYNLSRIGHFVESMEYPI